MKLSIIVGILLALLSALPVRAGQQTIAVSIDEETKGGPDTKILTAVAEALNAGIMFRYAPFKRRLLMMEKGLVDMTCGILRRPEREAYIHYILPPYKKRSDTIFFVPKGKAGQIRQYEDLKTLKIGMVRGSKYFIRFDGDMALQKEEVHNDTGNFKKLLLGRLDAVIISECTGIHLIHKLGIAQAVEISPYRFSKKKSVYLGISKKSGLMDDIDRVEATIRLMINNGEIGRIIKAYYTDRNLPVPAF